MPDDVALVLFDDIPWGAAAQSAADGGRAADLRSRRVTAARILLDRILEPHRPVRRVALQTTLIVRASCGAALAGRHTRHTS